VLVAALALAGCSNSPSSPSPTTLSGTWRIVSLQLTGQPFIDFLPPEVTYQATFENQRVSVRTNCNTCNGAFTISGSTVTIGPALACTRVACVSPAYEGLDNDVTTVLGGQHEMTESLGRLTLQSSRGTLTLRQQ
jgi:heat shock protein HslJ